MKLIFRIALFFIKLALFSLPSLMFGLIDDGVRHALRPTKKLGKQVPKAAKWVLGFMGRRLLIGIRQALLLVKQVLRAIGLISIFVGRGMLSAMGRIPLLGIKDAVVKIILISFAVSVVVLAYIINPWITLIALVIAAVIGGVFFYFVWRFLAPSESNRSFTFIDEGTAKVVVKAGKFDRALIQWNGYTLDKNWNVVPDGTRVGGMVHKEPWHPFGGLRFYGIWPIKDIFTHRLRWNDLRQGQAGEGEAAGVRFHDEQLDYVLLRPDVYWTKLSKAETKPPERIPVSVEFLITMRVINPYKALFAAPINWVDNVMARSDALFRSFVSGSSLDSLLKTKGRDKALNKMIAESDLIQKTFKEEWGIEVLGIQIRSIDIADSYAQAAASQRVEEMKARGQSARIKTEYGAIEQFGDLGRLVRTLEAIEKSPLAASMVVQAIPGLPEVLRGVFGKPSEAVTQQEIKELREKLEEVLASQKKE